jgi:RNA polymerase sigma-70 factor (ECF subfamily)
MTDKEQTVLDVARRRAAYAALIREYEGCLLRTACRFYNGNEHDAQDCVQEALVRGYQAYVEGRFQEGTNARAWLLRILTNVFLNDHRQRRRWNTAVDAQELAEADASCVAAGQTHPVERPETALLAATLDEPLERALAALSAELRLSVILVDIEGLEYAEAAAMLNIPIGTVRSRLSRARLQLHSLLYSYAQERRRV